jgi:hypothetical protein
MIEKVFQRDGMPFLFWKKIGKHRILVKCVLKNKSVAYTSLIKVAHRKLNC